MTTIKFGTDGWRAVIGKDFIPENIEKVIQAFADIYPKVKDTGKPIYIGYDRRGRSRESAELVAEVLTANGINVFLAEQFCPTPCVSWMVANYGGCAGVMITASHNPPEWNGIKFKESYGGAASPEYTAPIEEMIRANDTNGKTSKTKKLPNENFKTFDPKKEYVERIKNFVDLKAIQNANFKVLAETMYGSAGDYWPAFLGTNVTQLHTAADPTFGGIQPEPIPPHINEAIEKMKAGRYDVCLVTDGDADRIGAIDENGIFVNPHQIFSLLLLHLYQDRGWKGRVIKSLTTTRMLNRICDKFGIELVTTPVGFKYISPMLNEPGVLMGGEESGGIGIPRFVCERDGLICGLLILEVMAKRGKKLGELVAELQKNYGPLYYKRSDLHLDNETVARAKKTLETLKLSELCGRKVTEESRVDGWLWLRDDQSWLLVRSSGTEPLMRIYTEAGSTADVDAMQAEAKRLLGI